MADLKLIETGNGGDLVLLQQRGDLEITEGWGNMPYIGLYGGNREQSTQEFTDGEQRLDWWGNNLLMDQDSSIQFNSGFESLSEKLAISSAGRLQLQQQVKTDLRFMEDFAIVDATVVLSNVDRIEILITVQEPDNLESNQFIYIWDGTKLELNIIEQ